VYCESPAHLHSTNQKKICRTRASTATLGFPLCICPCFSERNRGDAIVEQNGLGKVEHGAWAQSGVLSEVRGSEHGGGLPEAKLAPRPPGGSGSWRSASPSSPFITASLTDALNKIIT
jgi:hypothetical protein